MMWVCRTRLVDSYAANYFPIGFDGMHVVIRDQEEFHAVRLANDANMALRTLTLLRGEADDEGESIDDYWRKATTGTHVHPSGQEVRQGGPEEGPHRRTRHRQVPDWREPDDLDRTCQPSDQERRNFALHMAEYCSTLPNPEEELREMLMELGYIRTPHAKVRSHGKTRETEE